MELVASLQFFKHFTAKALRLGVVVLTLGVILLSSLAPSGPVFADNHLGDPLGSVESLQEAAEGLKTGAAVGAVAAPFVVPLAAGIGAGVVADKTISLLITALAAIYGAIGKAIGYMIPITIGIVINVLNYNSFGDSFIVTIGWPIMRDLINMSVIIILLVIAIRTMVGMGGGAQGAQQALGRLFFAVLLVNFSKTITLLLIDASQVVMLTFVNALDVAAGNFVELFQINAILSTSWNVVGNFNLESDVPAAVGFLVNSFLSTFLLAIVLMTLVILGIVFLYRVVVLWMLVVLSPVALFFYGLGDILPGASGAVAEWRKRFVGALTIGPILAFFLWLSLAAASQGAAIAETEGFNFFENETASTFLEIFQPAKLLSLGLGIMLLVIGMQLAASSAASLGEFSGSLVAKLPGWSSKLAKISTFGAAKVGARAMERKSGFGQMASNSFTAGAAKVQSGQSFLGNNRVAMGLGAAAAYVGGVAQDVSAEPDKTAREASRKRVAAMSDEQKHAYGMMLEKMKPEELKTLSETERDNLRTFAFEMGTNNDARKAEHSLTVADLKSKEKKQAGESAEDYDKRISGLAASSEEGKLKNAFASFEENKGIYIEGNKDRKKAIERGTIQHAHAAELKNAVGSPKRRAAMEALVNGEEWSLGLNNENNMSDPDYVLALAKREQRKDKEGNPVSALDDVASGKGGVSPKARDMANAVIALTGGTDPGRIEAYLRRNTGRFAQPTVTPGTAPVAAPDPREALKDETLNPRALAQAVRDGVKGADIEVDHLQVDGKAGGAIDQGRIEMIVKEAIRGNADMAGMDPGVETHIVSAIERLRNDANANHKVAAEAQARAALASAEKNDTTRLQKIGLGTDGNFIPTSTREQKQTTSIVVNNFVNNRPTEIYKLRPGIKAGGTNLTEMIRETINERMMTALKVAKDQANADGNKAQLTRILDSVETAQEALTHEIAKMVGAGADPDEVKAVRKQFADLGKIKRY